MPKTCTFPRGKRETDASVKVNSYGIRRGITEGGPITEGGRVGPKLRSSKRVRGPLHETWESFLMQPVSVDKLLVERSVSWQEQQVEWHFPDTRVVFNSLLIGGG